MGKPTRHVPGAHEQPDGHAERKMPQDAADQPRPALGRRPWLALERRARSLRRFFFAIAGGRVPPSAPQPSSVRLVDEGSGWASPPVEIAAGVRRRYVGSRGRQGARAILIAGSSVHGVGSKTPLRVVGIDPTGRVRRRGVLEPRAIVWFPECRWILELPADHSAPPRNVRLAWRRRIDDR